MADEVLIVVPSHPLTLALQTAPSSNANFLPTFTLTQTQPSGDGIYPAGFGGMTTANRFFLAPFCAGPTGAQFSMRVWAWRNTGTTSPDTRYDVWIPFLLVELACTAGELQGPAVTGPAASAFKVSDTERMCDTISLTQGSVGLSGEINSTGPGTNLPAYAIVELRGAQLFQFDFQQQDGVTMNCLWSRV